MPLRTPDLIPSVFVADSSGDDEDRASEVVLPQQRQRVLSQVGICVIECQQHRSPGKRSRFAAPVKPICGTNANVAPTHQPTEVPLDSPPEATPEEALDSTLDLPLDLLR